MEKERGIVKISISISAELDKAIVAMCVKTGLSKSRLIDSILRENKDINRFIQARRSETGGFFAAKSNDSNKSIGKDKNNFLEKESH